MDKINEIWKKYKSSNNLLLREELVKNYLQLVKYIINGIIYHLPDNIRINEKEDLFIEGIIGLIDAIERFDLTRNIKFETYASKRIRGTALDYLRKQDILPKNVREAAKKIENAYTKFEILNGRAANDDEITKELGMTKEEFYDTLYKIKVISIFSIESEIFSKNGEKFVIQDLIGKDSEINDLFDYNETVKYLSDFIDELDKQERIILEMYYWDELTLKEIGKALELTESRVCQIHTKIVLKIRSRFKKLERER